MMSFGMGLVFVPLTQTAVHHLRAEDSGIGSGVLNTMQQVGGALGLSLLGTIATQTFNDRTADLGAAAQSAGGADQKIQAIVFHQAFTEGATHAFLTGAGMIWLGTVIALVFLNARHEDLATDGPEVAHAGV